jgi:hypothetical protein
MRFFNTAGPVNCQDHYCLPPLTRFDLGEILTLIDQKKYFILHAPRQVGKTTYLLALRDYLNQADRYRCVYFNVELAQVVRENVEQGIQAILNQMASRARTSLGDLYVQSIWPKVLERAGGNAALEEVLTLWAEHSPKPLVLLIDEIDSLVGDTLISILRQLRAGYDKRPALFPQSIILCGVRDVRDYRIHSGQEKAIVTGGSAFNIRAKSLRLENFDQTEVKMLYDQHTVESGQQFEPSAIELVWQLTQGQPWLTNALGYELCFEMKEGQNRSRVITADMVIQAKENLILRRETHIDQLVDKLKEARIQRVISPMLQGHELDQTVSQDDIQYVIDLGLVSRSPQGLQIANPIYREIIPRELGFITQLNFESLIQPAWYIAADGRLDIDKLLTAFQQFFRENSEYWVERFDYREAGPQLLLQAFLQRIINGGGRVEREYGLGRQRTDLLLIWPYPEGVQRVAIELKIVRDSLKQTIKKGLIQTYAYMDRCATDRGHLMVFDQDKTKSWDEKIFKRTENYRGYNIEVWGM